MINKNDSSVIDYHEFTSINCEGDEVRVVIAMTYDYSDGLYTIEQWDNGESQEYAYYGDRLDAELSFERFVKSAQAYYDYERRNYENSLINPA